MVSGRDAAFAGSNASADPMLSSNDPRSSSERWRSTPYSSLNALAGDSPASESALSCRARQREVPRVWCSALWVS